MTPAEKFKLETEPVIRGFIKECQEKIAAITNIPVSVYFRVKFHHLPTEELIRIICSVCEVKWSDILSDSRKANNVIARQLFCWFACTVQNKPLQQIGRILGRDHTTVIHAREKIRDMKAINDELYVGLIDEIDRRIDDYIITSKLHGANTPIPV